MIKKLLFLLTILFAYQAHSQFFEGFEGTIFPPAGWNVSDNGTGTVPFWREATIQWAAYEGVYCAYVDRQNLGMGTTSEEWLVTPAVAVSASDVLSFYSRQTFKDDQGTIYQIRVSATSQTDHSSFLTAGTWDENNIDDDFAYGRREVSLNAYSGQSIYIAFVMVHFQPEPVTSGDRWLLDNVSVGLENLGTKTEQFMHDDLKLYPNPVADRLNIQVNGQTQLLSAEAFNNLGQSVFTSANTKQIETIDVSEWTAGVYLIKIQTTKGQSTKRFIKL